MEIELKEKDIMSIKIHNLFRGNGEEILNHLAKKFRADDETFVRDNERLSCYYAGQRSVMIYINNQIKLAKELTK